MHGEICAVPAERLQTERELLATSPSLRHSLGKSVTRKVDALSCVRFASARQSVPTRLIGTQVKLRMDANRSVSILTSDGMLACEHTLVAAPDAKTRGSTRGWALKLDGSDTPASYKVSPISPLDVEIKTRSSTSGTIRRHEPIR